MDKCCKDLLQFFSIEAFIFAYIAFSIWITEPRPNTLYKPAPERTWMVRTFQKRPVPDYSYMYEGINQIYKIPYIEYSYTVIEQEYDYEYLCKGYMTAYCAEECGWNYSTASGAICHYSDEWYEPTTCAIDRNYFHFGDLFMIEGKIYVAEDTGSAVKGLHWDLYFETLDEVYEYGSHYADVYSVTITDVEVEYTDGFYLNNTNKLLQLEAEHENMVG